MAGIPVRLRRCWGASCFVAPRLPSGGRTYRGSTGVSSLCPPGSENGLGGVVVAVVDHSALRARPRPNLQWQFVESVPTVRAGFARCQPPRHGVHGAAVAVGFLVDDPHELTPSGIADCPCQTTVSDHPHDVEVFDVDHLILANQRQSLLVVIVPPSTGNLVGARRLPCAATCPCWPILSAVETSPAPTAAASAACDPNASD